MKHLKNVFYLSVFALIAFGFTACESDFTVQDDLTDTVIENRASVTPTLYANWQSGDAASECEQVGFLAGTSTCELAWKLDASAPNGAYNTPTDPSALIEISNSDGLTFDWTSDHYVCAVIVKAGQGALVYEYPERTTCSDTDLESVAKEDGTLREISHVTFCFSETVCGNDESCYQEETAWATGNPYNANGNGSWATYTDYPGDGGVVDIVAGQYLDAGTATFSENGDGTVDITVNLENSFIFYYDLGDDEEDENIKIQDYNSAPNGNPKIGKFDHKASATVGTTTYTITVPLNNYYGIHLDVAYEVPCE